MIQPTVSPPLKEPMVTSVGGKLRLSRPSNCPQRFLSKSQKLADHLNALHDEHATLLESREDYDEATFEATAAENHAKVAATARELHDAVRAAKIRFATYLNRKTERAGERGPDTSFMLPGGFKACRDVESVRALQLFYRVRRFTARPTRARAITVRAHRSPRTTSSAATTSSNSSGSDGPSTGDSDPPADAALAPPLPDSELEIGLVDLIGVLVDVWLQPGVEISVTTKYSCASTNLQIRFWNSGHSSHHGYANVPSMLSIRGRSWLRL